MGWTNRFHCEWNPFGQKVLKHYWPQAERYTDITKTDFTLWRGKIDILTGGFPCQPYSTAGKRLGKEDDRHLWPEMLRAIREIQPRYVVGENVSGLVNWNGGMVFDEVQADLEAQGYEVRPFILPACAVNAPHRRDRVWFVAYSDKCATGSPRSCGEFDPKWSRNDDEQKGRGEQTEQHFGYGHVSWNAPHPSLQRSQGSELNRSTGAKRQMKDKSDCLVNQFAVSGKSSQLNPRFVMEMMGFPPDWTELPFRNGEMNPSKPEEMPSCPK
jgi:DNA (cytosine-5)-methyltransferase 1